jgi:thiamine biosynthesis lipoprotein ApbE
MQLFTCMGLNTEKADDDRVKQLQNEIHQLKEQNKLLEQIHSSPKSEVARSNHQKKNNEL